MLPTSSSSFAIVVPFGVTFEMSRTSVSVARSRAKQIFRGMNYNQRKRAMHSALSAIRQQEMSIFDSSCLDHCIYLQHGWRGEARRIVGCPSDGELALRRYLALVFRSYCSTLFVVGAQDKPTFADAIRETPATVVQALICFFSIWSVLGLWGYHTYLICRSITTNEDVRETTMSGNDVPLISLSLFRFPLARSKTHGVRPIEASQ